MLERAKAGTRRGPSTSRESARCAAALGSVVEASPQHDGLLKAGDKRLREELATLEVASQEEKSRIVDRAQGEPCSCLGFDGRRVRRRPGVWRAWYPPKRKKRPARVRQRKAIGRRYQSHLLERVIALINPILRGGVRDVAVGDARRCFGCLTAWVDKQVRRHLRRARKRRGCGGKRWRRPWLSQRLGLCNNYRGHRPRRQALPT